MGVLGGTSALAKAFAMAGLLTGVDQSLLSSLCFVESHHKVGAVAPHDGGSASFGVCQIKLGTARSLGYGGTAGGLMDPSTNALYAAMYLAKQKRRYGTWEKAVSAFNCGHVCRNTRYVGLVMGGAMSFKKGFWYRCIDNTGGVVPFTLGNVYECVSDYDPAYSFVNMIDDMGKYYNAGAWRFDPAPVATIVSAPPPGPWSTLVGNSAAQSQAAIIGGLLGKINNAPSVSSGGPLSCCGKRAEKKVFATFEYFYCTSCRKEVGGKNEFHT